MNDSLIDHITNRPIFVESDAFLYNLDDPSGSGSGSGSNSNSYICLNPNFADPNIDDGNSEDGAPQSRSTITKTNKNVILL